MELTFLRRLYENAGSFASVYLDTTGAGGGADPKAVQARWRALREELLRAGAGEATVDALEDVLTGPGMTAPGTAAFGQDGAVRLAVRLPAVPLREMARWALLPDVLPLLIQSPPRPLHLLVSATLAGGGVLAVRTADDVTKESVQGTGWPVHKTGLGGWSEHRYQHSTEEAWETNAKELADAVVSRAAGASPEAVIVAGDVRARNLLIEKLPTDLAGKVATVDRELDLESSELAEAAEEALRSLEEAGTRRRLEMFRDQAGTGRATEGLAETVAALRDGQVSELFLSGDYLAEDRELPAPAWSSAHAWIGPELADIGLSEDDLRTRGVSDVTRDRADAALIRAAAGTSASLYMVPPGEPALRDDIGALLRYAAPGA